MKRWRERRTVNAEIPTTGAEREELLTQEEVATKLKVAVRTVERWQQDGTLPFLQLGNAVRFYWPAVVSHLITNFTICRFPRPATATLTKGGGR